MMISKLRIINHKLIILILILIIINFNSQCSAGKNEREDANWNKFRHNTQNIGHQTNKGSGKLSNYGIIWYRYLNENSIIYGEPTISNIDLIGDKEIIIGNDLGYLYCLDINGNIKWKYLCSDENSFMSNNRISSTANLVNIIGNQSLEIIFGSGNGRVYCLNAWGELVWTFQADDVVDSSPTYGDITGDGKLDIVFTSYDDNVYTITNDGKLIWKYNIDDSVIACPVIVDINFDNINDIIIGGKSGKLYALTTKYISSNSDNSSKYIPELLWTYETEATDILGILGSPVVIDLNRDNKYEIIFGASDGKLYCLEYNGKLIWDFLTDGPIYNTPAIGDINRDGKYEIIIGTSGKSLYAIDSEGHLIWQVKYQIKVAPNPVIFDIDGDNFLEITSIDKSHNNQVSDENYFIYSINILNYKGELSHRLRYAFKCYDFLCGISVADLDSDGKLEILAGTENGYIYCYGEIKDNEENSNESNRIDKNPNNDYNYYYYSLGISSIVIIIVIFLIQKIRKRRN